MLKEGAKIHPELKMNRLVYGALVIDPKSCCTVCAHQTVLALIAEMFIRKPASRQEGGDAFFHSATENQTISVLLFFLTTLAGSAVLRINKSFFAVSYMCAAGAAVSAEGLSWCNKALVARSESYGLLHFDRCSCGSSDHQALDSKEL